jgi:diguanylate cyclase (GGDEF)-like protein
MDIDSNDRLLKTIRLIPVLLSAVFTLIIIGILITNNRVELNRNISDLRVEFNERQKQKIKNRVDTIYQQVSYERERMENSLKSDIKERVYQAHNIAQTIYSENRDKPDTEIYRLIVTALKSIRFNDGRGYFFIYDQQGNSIMLPGHAEQEGINQWDMQDSKGTYIVRELVSITKNRKEGFNKWSYYKPDNSTDELEKIGFVKLFEPFGWIIGTGEYLADFEANTKKSLLHWISTIRFDETGYMFVIDDQGVILAHQIYDLISKTYRNVQNVADIKAFVGEAKRNGGYITYLSTYQPANVKSPDKISYVKWYPDWQWAIGTGVYKSDIEAYLQKKELAVVKLHRGELIIIMLFSVLLIVFVGFLSYYLGQLLASRFASFESKIETSFVELENANTVMEHMALHDPLTGLYNRFSLAKYVKEHLFPNQQAGNRAAIVFVDLDDFKYVNDLHGHEAGDDLLCAISRRFERLLGVDDGVCRFGGDEFLFCFSNLSCEADIFAKVAQVKDIFDRKIACGELNIKVNCTIGVSVYPDDGVTSDVLIRRADVALYRAKKSAKGSVCLFEAEFDEQIKYRYAMEQDIHKALDRDEFEVCYQPQINARNDQMVSVEALCCWNSPALGQISPVEFIPIAEKCGAISKLGLFVIKRACSDILSISANGEGALGLSINISPIQVMEPGFCNEVWRLVKSTGIDVSRVTFELTESAAIDKIAAITPCLHQLRLFGFGLSLDDFGTGFSSLSYLNDLPFTEIKIDRSFIDKFLRSYQSDALVRTIVAIGDSFGMRVVAEGVETQEQYERLAQYNCSLLQGYLFDKPLSLADLTVRMARGLNAKDCQFISAITSFPPYSEEIGNW